LPTSSRHSKVAPVKLVVNANVAVRSRVLVAGFDVIVGADGRLMVHVYERDGLVPVELRARTLNVCVPYGSDEYALGLEQLSQIGRMSMRHWYDVAPDAVNRNVALSEDDGFGGAEVIVGVGGAAARTAAAGVAAAAGESVTAVLA
jgi:hypothetical protein